MTTSLSSFIEQLLAIPVQANIFILLKQEFFLDPELSRGVEPEYEEYGPNYNAVNIEIIPQSIGNLSWSSNPGIVTISYYAHGTFDKAFEIGFRSYDKMSGTTLVSFVRRLDPYVKSFSGTYTTGSIGSTEQPFAYTLA